MGSFLKCDAAGCDHEEDRPDLLEGDIGRPCPKCGANLLTREDYEAAKPLWELTKLLEAAGLATFALSLEEDVGPDKIKVSVNVHKNKIITEFRK